MRSITLERHRPEYTERMSLLSADPAVKDTLGLTAEQVTVEGTREYINFILAAEEKGTFYSRVIFSENSELIGVTTLKEINLPKKTTHIGSWLGKPFWGMGYNELAKVAILKTAFIDLDLDYVFAGAKKENVRSLKAQEKLPYMTLGVGQEFPLELEKLERETGTACVLNVVEKQKFLDWYHANDRQNAGTDGGAETHV